MRRSGAAERFGVSESGANRWVEYFGRARVRTATKMGGYKRVTRKPRREFVKRLRRERPDITLQGLCDRQWAERGF